MRKDTKEYKEQDRVKIMVYQSQIDDIPMTQIAYIDETGLDAYLYREYHYSQRI